MSDAGISVIVPTYNCARFLGEALASVRAQTHPVRDVIVVDDGSTDDTAQVLSAAVAADPHLIVLRQANAGVARARNAGVARAGGALLAFLDADDVWAPEKLSRQMALWDGRAALVHTDRRNVGERGSLPELASQGYALHRGDVFERLLTAGNFITCSTVLMRRDVFERVGGFTTHPDIPVCEDWDLWLRAAERHTVQCVDAPLCDYRLHAQGTSRSPDRMCRARLAVIGRALALPRAAGMSRLSRARIVAETLRTNAWDYRRHGDLRHAAESAARSALHLPSRGAARELVLTALGRRD